MKIQCNVCEMAEATVLCCADEAALCWTCDEKVHAANKLASKHQRVHLSTYNSQMPKCDICQESVGYFFCLEDRALLCRKCDVAIHTVNTSVSSHQRFLLTGVKVGLEAAAPTSSRNSNPAKNISDAAQSPLPPMRSVPLSSTGQNSKPQAAGAANFAPPSLPFAGSSSADGIQQWEFDEFLELNDFNQNYNYIDDVSSKADSGKLGESECVRGMDGEGFGQVPDASWAVPQMCSPSPPTASGLCWSKTHHHHHDFVPDVCYTPFPDLYGYHPQQSTSSSLKRRKQF